MQKQENILENLLDELLTLPKFKELELEKKTKLKAKLIKEYGDRINKVIITNIPINKSEEFLIILDEKNVEKVDKFITDNIPHIDELIEAETSRFIQQIILKGREELN